MQNNNYFNPGSQELDITGEMPKSRNPLRWWFRLSCPPEPADSAPLIQRERFRQARIVSIVTLLLLIFVITSIPAGFSGTNHTLLYLMIFAFCANVLAMYLNRINIVVAAALILVLNVEISMAVNLLTTPGGLSLVTLPLLDLLVIPLVLAASVLPIWYVLLFAIINSLFSISMTLNFFHLPQAPDLTAAIHAGTFSIVSIPVFIQFILAFIAFLWVRSATQAIMRADRAEQIAMLEHDIAESRQQVVEQKNQLEDAIQEISRALLTANTGQNFTRINTQGNVLWLLVGPINNLIARIQRHHTLEADYQRLNAELGDLLYALQNARAAHQPLSLPRNKQDLRLGVFYNEIAYLQAEMGRNGLPNPGGTNFPKTERL